MDDKEKLLGILEILFRYLKVILGITITFYPFKYGSPFDEIISILGILVILTSGIKITFRPDSLPVVKPN